MAGDKNPDGRDDVASCPRCGRSHRGVPYYRLTVPSAYGWSHYAFCPHNGEPIMLDMRKNNNGPQSRGGDATTS